MPLEPRRVTFRNAEVDVVGHLRVLEGFDERARYPSVAKHYITNDGWLENGQVIREACQLAAIPGTIVEGRYDMVCPTRTAWRFIKLGLRRPSSSWKARATPGPNRGSSTH